MKAFLSSNSLPSLAWACVSAALCLGLAPSASADAVNLGGAADYAVLGEGGTVSIESDFKVYQSGTVVNGNVGMGPYSLLQHGIDATINGRFDYDTTSSLNAQAITVPPSGGVHQIDLSSVVADARNASVAAAAFVPTQTFSTLTEGQTIVGNGGLNVIRITGDVTLKTTLTLQGGPNDKFVFQFTSATTAGHSVLTLSGMSMSIGTIAAANIVWDLNGLGGDVIITSGAMVFGTFLAPDRNLTSDHGIVDGRLIAGGDGSLLNVHSGSEITTPGVPDASSTLVLLSLGLGFLAAARKKFLS